MTDPAVPTVTTMNPVALGQLADEVAQIVGVATVPLRMSSTPDDPSNLDGAWTNVVEWAGDPGEGPAPLTQADLQAAVAAHTPTPPPPTVEAVMQAQLDELTDLTLTLLEGGL